MLLSRLAYWFTIYPRMVRLRKLLVGASISPAGSRYVCNPPPLSTDIDFLVYTEKSVDLVLGMNGYVRTDFRHYGGYVDNPGDFWAWRRGPVNLIVTSSLKYALAFHTATYICKEYNLLDKWERVLTHEVLRGRLLPEQINMLRQDKPELADLLTGLTGPYAVPLLMAYRTKHGLADL